MITKHSIQRYLRPVCALLLCATMVTSCKNEKPMTNNELNRKALALASTNKLKEAGNYAQKAVQQDPNDAKAFILYAIILDKLGEERALEMAQAAVKLDADNFINQYILGKVLLASNRTEDSYKHLEKAHLLDPGNQDCLILLAKAASLLKKTEAIKYYAKLQKTAAFKNKPDAFNEMGIIFDHKKSNKKAAKCFLRANKIAPNNPVANLNLAIFCDKTLNNKQYAVKYYKKYLQNTSHNASALAIKRAKVEQRIKDLSP